MSITDFAPGGSRQFGDFDINGHGFRGRGIEGAGDRSDVAIIAAVADADMIEVWEGSVGRIESFPPDLGDVELDPGVGGIRSGTRFTCRGSVSCVDVTANITSGYGQKAGHGDEEVRKILADASFCAEDIEGRGAESSRAGGVGELTKEGEIDIEQGFENIAMVTFDESHGVVVELCKLGVRKFLGREIRCKHFQFPGHPDKRKDWSGGESFDEIERINIQHFHFRFGFDKKFGIRRSEVELRGEVAKDVFELGHGPLGLWENIQLVRTDGLLPVVYRAEVQAMRRACDCFVIVIRSAVADFELSFAR